MTYLTNEHKAQIFDDESILDPTVTTILRHPYKHPTGTTAGLSASVPPPSSIKVDGGDGGECTADMAGKNAQALEKEVQALEKELAKLKLAKDEVEHELRSERGRRTAAEKNLESLQNDLQESQDLVAQLQKRSTRDL